MSINIEISIGEFWDKITILQIKADRIKDKDKLINITKDLNQLVDHWEKSSHNEIEIDAELKKLRHINEQLWDIEDNIRDKELAQEFDDVFVELARSVYFTNDKRAEVKKEINKKMGSSLVEEKSYKEYNEN
jgi:hypothetical protein